ncbi:ExeA-like protein [Escherichia coli]|uniref:ExeA-like protein n=1 Tax=Escherichia coli TaxID=562 RepID=A0A376LMQ9_ECOLX|nr:ExeA-like protein [Escherichia coli]
MLYRAQPRPVQAGTTDKTSLSEEENMLLKKQVLFPATKKAFGLFRDPFADESHAGF